LLVFESTAVQADAMNRYTRTFVRFTRSLSALDGRVFYIGLAVAMAAWACVNYSLHRESRIQGINYDWMTRHRFHTPQPDPDIVILDIDEKSLSQMSAEYGRWPWPRDVLGAVLAELETQGAQAVVFDVLFSDPDRQNPAADKAFADAVAAGDKSYFPVLRLNPANDGNSHIRAADMRGLVLPTTQDVDTVDRTLALVPPYFASAVASGRLGTHNIYPDRDGVIRRYELWEDASGWRIVSLPQKLALSFGWPQQPRAQRLLQWMDQPLAFRTVSFSDFYQDTQRRNKTRPRDEFKGRIVVIGATAPSLFDVKGTALAAVHPGVDVLATAIDNAKNDRFLRELPAEVELLVSLAVIALMAWLSIRYTYEQMSMAFLAAPSALLTVSWLSLNTGSFFIDLSAPASFTFLYFTLAKVYSILVRQYWSGHAPLAVEPGQADRMGCLVAVLPQAAKMPAFETRFFNLLRRHAPHASASLNLGSGTGWLEPVFHTTVVASWACASESQRQTMQREAEQLKHKLPLEFTEASVVHSCFIERSLALHTADGERDAQLRQLVLDALHPASPEVT
jgi:adenylate cyclase